MEGWDRQTVAWCLSHAWKVWTGERQLGTVTHGRLGPVNGSLVGRLGPVLVPQSRIEGWGRQTAAWCSVNGSLVPQSRMAPRRSRERRRAPRSRGGGRAGGRTAPDAHDGHVVVLGFCAVLACVCAARGARVVPHAVFARCKAFANAASRFPVQAGCG